MYLMAETKDFFISYNHKDEQWASWIAWQLEQASFTIVLQAWDFRPGNNFALEMDKAARLAQRTIIVLSPHFLASEYVKPEWAAAFAKDPAGNQAALVPVVVEPCEAEGLLGQLIHINLVGLDPEAAAKQLIAGLSPDRAKPLTPPVFPGKVADTHSRNDAPSGSARAAPVPWTSISTSPGVAWRSSLDRTWESRSSHSLVELHLIPLDGPRVEVRRLNNLQGELAALGRQAGIFTPTEQLGTRATAEHAFARASDQRDDRAAGLLVTRSGQRGTWITLPRDGLGSVLDPQDMGPRLAALLRLLMTIDVPLPTEFAITAALRSTMMLTIGSADVLGRRHSASMGMSSDDVELPVEDAIRAAQVERHADAIAEEVVARLVARLQERR